MENKLFLLLLVLKLFCCYLLVVFCFCASRRRQTQDALPAALLMTNALSCGVQLSFSTQYIHNLCGTFKGHTAQILLLYTKLDRAHTRKYTHTRTLVQF